MREAKEKERKEFDKIVWRKQRRTRDTIKDEKLEKLTNMEVEVSLPKVTSKEEIYNQMKDKFRMAWKSRSQYLLKALDQSIKSSARCQPSEA